MKKVLLSILFASAATFASAQKSEVSAAKKAWNMFQLLSSTKAAHGKQIESLTGGIENTTKAISDEKTKALPEVWSLRAIMASTVAILDTTNVENSVAHQKIAEEALAKAEELDTEKKEKANIDNAKLNITNTLKNRAFSAYGKKDFAGAYQYFSEVADKNPTDTAMALNAGLMAKTIEKYPETINYYKKVIALNSPLSEGLYGEMIDMAFSKLKDTAQALKYIQEGSAKFPNSDDFVKQEAQYYISKGDIVKSEEMLNKLLVKEPDNHVFQYLKGDVYYKQALGFQEEKNKLDSKKVKESEALSKKVNEFVDKSLPFYEKSAQLNPKYAPALETLKQIYAFKNDTKKYEVVKKQLAELTP